jgi:ADP-ribosylglycohydrolase
MPSRPVAEERAASASAAVRRSALWAAWGDAMGFPSELVRDTRELERRTGEPRVESTKPWRRRVGGRMGVDVTLPAGMYSDDTQLRLAVGRCIRAVGRFDAEAFSKIELPVFLSYGFGIGRGTRAAAQSLTKRSVRWYSNFFETRGVRYVDGGGNGAAMRIQPHVWSAPRFSPNAFLPNLMRDSVITHGHVRGLLGAALHAVSLGVTLREGAPPKPSRWAEMFQYLERLPQVVAQDDALQERWLPVWEKNSGVTFSEAVGHALSETLPTIAAAHEAANAKGSLPDRYAELAKAVGGLDPSTRGSGILSAILALWLGHCGAEDPEGAIRCASNLLGSDTDTIGSMAGALLGVGASDDLPGPLVDEALIAAEAERLAILSSGGLAPSFPHPDPLRWHAPKTQADALGMLGDDILLAGLGPAKTREEPVRAHDGALWQWVELDFGQNVLVKRREELPRLGPSARPLSRLVAVEGNQAVQQELVEDDTTPPKLQSKARAETREYPDDVVEGVQLLVARGFDLVLMSRLLEHYSQQEHGVTKAALFGGLVAQALQARDRAAQR